MLKQIETAVLNIAYDETGLPDGWPVLLLHGFPYDIHAFDAVAPLLQAQGARVIVPYLRGYGPTRFLSDATPRSGQQAAIGADIRDLLDALGIPQAILAGFDWGARAACIAAALWPDRVRGLVTQNGYMIQDIGSATTPQAPEMELRLWYQYYFHGERGYAGLRQNRHRLCKLLWGQWSPSWKFEDATYAQTAEAFDNPDFVDVAIHSYRHRFGQVQGDPIYELIERELTRQPPIQVAAISLDGSDDGVRALEGAGGHAHHFTGRYAYRVVAKAGHNIPQEAPDVFAEAVMAVHRWTVD